MKNNNYNMEGGFCFRGYGNSCKKKVNGTIKNNRLQTKKIIPALTAPEIPNIINTRTKEEKNRSKKICDTKIINDDKLTTEIYKYLNQIEVSTTLLQNLLIYDKLNNSICISENNKCKIDTKDDLIKIVENLLKNKIISTDFGEYIINSTIKQIEQIQNLLTVFIKYLKSCHETILADKMNGYLNEMHTIKAILKKNESTAGGSRKKSKKSTKRKNPTKTKKSTKRTKTKKLTKKTKKLKKKN